MNVQVKIFFWVLKGTSFFESGQKTDEQKAIFEKKFPEVIIFSVTPRNCKIIYQAIFEKFSGQKMGENNDKHDISKRSSVGKGRP